MVNTLHASARQRVGPSVTTMKNFIVLMALVDADYKFIWADVGSMGAASDVQIHNSELKELAEGGALGLLFPDPLPNDFRDVPYFFVGDDAFTLRETLVKP